MSEKWEPCFCLRTFAKGSDYSNLTLEQGEEVGEGANLTVFKVNDVAVKVHGKVPVSGGMETLKELEANQEREDKIMDVLGKHPGIQEKATAEKVYQIAYAFKEGNVVAAENVENGALNIRRTKLYGGNMNRFPASEDKDQKIRQILSMQNNMAHAYQHVHAKECFHLDGKMDNVFYKENIDGGYDAILGDFGEAAYIPKGRPKDALGVPWGTIGTSEMTRKEEELNFQEISKKDGFPGDEAAEALRRIDCFQQGVVFYQMAMIGNNSEDNNLPYEINTKGFHPRPGKLKSDVKQKLEAFYGKTDPRVDCILGMISMDPTQRPSDDEIVRAFSTEEAQASQ
jgi:hypothetical protein